MVQFDIDMNRNHFFDAGPLDGFSILLHFLTSYLEAPRGPPSLPPSLPPSPPPTLSWPGETGYNQLQTWRNILDGLLKLVITNYRLEVMSGGSGVKLVITRLGEMSGWKQVISNYRLMSGGSGETG